jgi:hypothetical protein
VCILRGMSEDKDEWDIDPRRHSLFALTLAAVFPEWSSKKIARWLDLNPRSLQRMLGKGPDSPPIPDRVKKQAGEMADRVRDARLAEHLDDFIASMRSQGIDDDVIAAWLSSRHKRLVDRDIE